MSTILNLVGISDRSFKNGAGEEFQWKIDGKLYVSMQTVAFVARPT